MNIQKEYDSSTTASHILLQLAWTCYSYFEFFTLESNLQYSSSYPLRIYAITNEPSPWPTTISRNSKWAVATKLSSTNTTTHADSQAGPPRIF
jgi:hypothetical protein